MQRGHSLELECQKCSTPVRFSILKVEKHDEIVCENCKNRYQFEDERLVGQLKKFEALCHQIHASEEILGQTSVGVDVAGKQVKIPFKLLLTRLSSCLELSIGGQPCTIAFRFEPLNDLQN